MSKKEFVLDLARKNIIDGLELEETINTIENILGENFVLPVIFGDERHLDRHKELLQTHFLKPATKKDRLVLESYIDKIEQVLNTDRKKLYRGDIIYNTIDSHYEKNPKILGIGISEKNSYGTRYSPQRFKLNLHYKAGDRLRDIPHGYSAFSEMTPTLLEKDFGKVPFKPSNKL